MEKKSTPCVFRAKTLNGLRKALDGARVDLGGCVARGDAKAAKVARGLVRALERMIETAEEVNINRP